MAGKDIKLTITGRHMDITDQLRQYMDDKLQKVSRFFDRLNEAHVVITHEKYRFLAEITLTAANGMSFSASAETGDAVLSIDNALEVLKRQVKKGKGKKYENKRHRRTENIHTDFGSVEEPELETGDNNSKPAIVKTRRLSAKPMSIDEAAMQMTMVRENFFVFINAETHGVCVLYRLDDGNYGLIETEH